MPDLEEIKEIPMARFENEQGWVCPHCGAPAPDEIGVLTKCLFCGEVYQVP